MRHAIDWCYLCGAREKLTKDHVPPKNLFPLPRPKNLITVPCCERCNSGFSKADERFRVYVSTPINSSESGKWILREKVFGSTFIRSPALKRQFRSDVSLARIRTPYGIEYVSVISFDKQLFAPVLVRITKGLLAAFHSSYDYRSDEFNVSQVSQFAGTGQGFESLRRMLICDERGDKVFGFCRRVTEVGEKMAGIWIYRFYDSAMFIVEHSVHAELWQTEGPRS